jgi:calcineurin-like phosphoesterase family protein
LESLGFNGTVFVPERSDKTVKIDYFDQVEWEYAALNEAKVIVFWVPRDMKTMPAFTTNVEFGLWIAKGKKVLYGRPRIAPQSAVTSGEDDFAPECPKNRYLDWLYGKECGIEQRNIATRLGDVLSAAMGHLCQSAEPLTFITADWHLGEKRMGLMQRPFASAEEQTEVLVRNHNRLVKPNDIVIMNGDAITIQPELSDMLRLLPTINRFNGRKTLIRGNHDRKLTNEHFAPYFERIVEDGDGLDFEDGNGLKLWATHYPSQSRVDRYNLTGHIHSAWKVQKNMLNVGVDVHAYFPVPVKAATSGSPQPPAFFLKAVSEFYDDDVHCAQHPANAGHFERGKKGRYFDVKGEVGGKPA